jgi:myo-inositol-1(or 4)-monophosphatase
VKKTELDPSLFAGAHAARDALRDARKQFSKAELGSYVGMGADGTPTMKIDDLVEDRIVAALEPFGCNIVSEELGFIDRGSALTLVMDPLDGSANAANDIPLACYSAALAVDGEFVEALTMWLETGQQWGANTDGSLTVGAPAGGWKTSGCEHLAGAAISLLRPHPSTWLPWKATVEKAARVRILSCSTLESVLVLQGSTDLFADCASDTQRLVDLAAAVVLLPIGGGVVMDLHDRPIGFTTDLTCRWSGIVASSESLAREFQAVTIESLQGSQLLA